MFLTKRRIALYFLVFLLGYFTAIFSFQERLDGYHTDAPVLFLSKIGFLSVTAAFISSFLLMLIFRWSFFKNQAAGFKKYRHYLWMLVKRDFIARYRKSVLGVLWSVLNPLLTMLVLYIVFSQLFRFDIENFPVYLLSGSILFGFMNESTTLSMGSIIAGEGVIKKVYVPKYVFPLSKMLSSLVNLGFSFVAFMLVFVITGAQFTWTMLLIPLPLIYLFVFSLGLAMLLSSLAVFFRDLTYLYGILLTLWMYLTPIFYPVEGVIPDWLRGYYGLNPMFQFINYFRNLVLWDTVPDLWSNMVCAAYALISLSIGTLVFMKRQNSYILYL